MRRRRGQWRLGQRWHGKLVPTCSSATSCSVEPRPSGTRVPVFQLVAERVSPGKKGWCCARLGSWDGETFLRRWSDLKSVRLVLNLTVTLTVVAGRHASVNSTGMHNENGAGFVRGRRALFRKEQRRCAKGQRSSRLHAPFFRNVFLQGNFTRTRTACLRNTSSQ